MDPCPHFGRPPSPREKLSGVEYSLSQVTITLDITLSPTPAKGVSKLAGVGKTPRVNGAPARAGSFIDGEPSSVRNRVRGYSRNPTPYGVRLARRFIKSLARI